MTKVAILPVAGEGGEVSYCAVAGDKHSQGSTAGEALDALTMQLSQEESGGLVIVQSFRPDGLFTADQQHRLSELMTRWRAARDAGKALSDEDQAELNALIQAELQASAIRAERAARELPQ